MLFLLNGDHSMGDIKTNGMFSVPVLPAGSMATSENRHLPGKNG
jgi:hypothetical protein